MKGYGEGWADLDLNFGQSSGIRAGGVEVALGYEFAVARRFRVGPSLRYQIGFDPGGSDLHLLAAGLSFSIPLFAGHAEPPVEPEPTPADSDSDSDGVPDEVDRCPTEAAGENADSNDPGCPLSDRDFDHDGLARGEDHCPRKPAGPRSDPDRPGCPDADADQDAVPDRVDSCPNKPGAPHRNRRRNGCPGRVRVVGNMIQPLKPITFRPDSAKLESRHHATLEAVVEALVALGVKKLRLEGVADDRKNPNDNLDLSRARARAVYGWMIRRGMSPTSIRVVGYGESRPEEADETGENRALHRRVEFRILDPAYTVNE